MIRRLLALLLAGLILAPVSASGGQIYVPATIESLTVAGQTIGDLIYADSTTSFIRLADVATGNALISGGVGAAPSWGKIGLTTHVSGTLAYGSGGTGATSYTTNKVLKAGASAFADSLLSDDGTNVTLASGQLLVPNGTAAAPSVAASAETTGLYFTTGEVRLAVSGALAHRFTASEFYLNSDGAVVILGTGADTVFGRRATGNIRLGAADAAAPVSQYLSVQNVATGTANTAGVDRYTDASQGTGTGAGGSHIWRVAPAGGAGSAQNALAAALTIDSTKLATFAGQTQVTPPATQTIAATNTIAADACGSIKRVTAAGAVTTSTTDTFTAPAAGNAGCIMYVVNVGANTITLDNNANFVSPAGADVSLGPNDAIIVGSTGASGAWYALSALVAN